MNSLNPSVKVWGFMTSSTGSQESRQFLLPISTQIETQVSQTPSAFDLQKLMSWTAGTGSLLVKEDAEYAVEKAFRFMRRAACSLPYSDRADELAHELALRVRGELAITPLKREIEE